MERATRADVARAAGVAPSTVSLVLNGRGRDVKIAPATIDRVKAAARELNYIPHAAARSLRRGKSHLIALLMAELPDDPFVPVVHTVLTTAMIDIQRHGYLLLPLFQSGDGASDAEVIRGVLGDTQLAGIIRETTSAEAFTSRLLANLGIPVVAMSMIEANPTGSESSLIRIDEGAGVRNVLSDCALVDPATGTGQGRAVFLAGPNTNHARQNPIARAFGPVDLADRPGRRLAGPRHLPGRRRSGSVRARRPIDSWIWQPGPPQRLHARPHDCRVASQGHDRGRCLLDHQRDRRPLPHDRYSPAGIHRRGGHGRHPDRNDPDAPGVALVGS